MMNRFSKHTRIFASLFAIFTLLTAQFVGVWSEIVNANSTPQSLPFSQDWTNAGLITVNDDWSGVPGIQGFLGQDITTGTAVDPRTLLTTSLVAGDLDVIANGTNPNTSTSGGVGEFIGIVGPPAVDTIALQGSGTADAPHIILYLNTTGQSNIRVAFNAKDIDGSADNSVQPIVTQYRVGNTGNFINVPGGFIPDASTGPSLATLVTPVAVTLPPAANNQPEVQVRIMTTNAVGSDEWIGIDDILVTQNGPANTARTNVDFNGDGKSDYAILRNENNQLVWYILTNGGGAAAYAWGLFNSDRPVPADWDGDGKSDVAIWREAPATQARFYILQSSTNTVRISAFGQTNDDPAVVGDYDGDGKADEAVYRCPTVDGQCTWYYRGSLNNPNGNVTYVPWGSGTPGTALPIAGDYDGDGKYDFCVRPNSIPPPPNAEGNSLGQFVLLRSADFGVEYITWGFNTDLVVPASDFDGDGKTDIAVARPGASNFELYILERDGGGTGATPILFGSPAANDDAAFGDYDGDGRQDVGVWRAGQFWIRQSSNNAIVGPSWGQQGDFTAASWFFPRN